MTIITDTITFATLPGLGTEAFGGKFYGLTTLKDGTHAAVILLPNKAQERMGWKKATAWAAEAGGVLPSRPVAALLYANAKSEFEATWHWTSDELQADTGDEDDASYAWDCNFGYGGSQSFTRKDDEGSARAVRLIPLTL